jgi:hypothetical protein
VLPAENVVMKEVWKGCQEIFASRSVRHWQLRVFLKPGPWFIAFFGRGPLKKFLIQELGDAYTAK